MTKSEIQAQFDHIVSKVLWPEFKKRGYKKYGTNFRFYDSLGWGKIVNIQKSASSDRNGISFTINTGLYLCEAELSITGRVSGEKFLEPSCFVRKRIGTLNGTRFDLWYDLSQQTVWSELEATVSQDVRCFVLPYLETIHSAEDVLQQIFRERGPDVLNSIRALFVYGHKAEARQWIADELASTMYTHRKRQLQSLRSELEAMQ